VKKANALFNAILLQAILDATSKSENTGMNYIRCEAENWLNSNNPMFHLCCDIAEISPEKVRAKVQSIKDGDCQWRASGGTPKEYLKRRQMRQSKGNSSKLHKRQRGA
jgi:hypothetical protein